MSADDVFEVFGASDPREHESEIERRRSGELLEESGRRTGSYSQEQWKVIVAEGEEIARAFAAAMEGGAAAASSEATAVAERHRIHIDRWFCACSHEVHRGRGEPYVTDERFSAYWDGFAEAWRYMFRPPSTPTPSRRSDSAPAGLLRLRSQHGDV